MSSHHPLPTPQPQQSGWVRWVRSTWSLGRQPPGKVLGTDLGAQTGPVGPCPPRMVRGSGSARLQRREVCRAALGVDRQPISRLASHVLQAVSSPRVSAWGGGLLLPVPPGQPSFTASQQCSVRGDTLGHPPLIPTQEDPLFLRPAALLSRGPGFCLGGEGLAAGFSAPWGVGQAHSISMQHRGPQGPPISATPGSFHRACTACEQAEVGPCTKAGSHRVCVGEASEPCF